MMYVGQLSNDWLCLDCGASKTLRIIKGVEYAVCLSKKCREPSKPDRRYTTTLLPWDLEFVDDDTAAMEGFAESVAEITEAYNMAYTPPERTPPKPDPRITPTTMKGNYPRENRVPSFTPLISKRKHDSPTFWQRMLAHVLCFIDWLNGEAPIEEDDKHMPDGEEMTTLADLFNEVEQVDERPEPPPPPEPPGHTNCKR